MAVVIGLTTACTVSDADVPASGGLSQNYFAVTSTIPIFDSSGEYLTPVMINPGLHFWNVAGLPDVVEQQGPPSTTSIPLILLFQGC